MKLLLEKFISKFYQAIILTLMAFLFLLLIYGGVQTWRVSHWKTLAENADLKFDAKIAKIKQKQLEDLAEKQSEIDKAKSAAALQEKQWSDQLLKAEQNYNAKLNQIQADAHIARATANSLSEQLKVANSRMSTASRETSDEYCATLGNVFERSIEEYTKMAKAADEHRANEEKLNETWPAN